MRSRVLGHPEADKLLFLAMFYVEVNKKFLVIFYSKTIMHAGSKFSSGEATKALESMLNKDKSSTSDEADVCLSDVTNTRTAIPSTDPDNNDKVSKNQKPVKAKNVSEAQSKKRPVQEISIQSSQPEKKKKTEQTKSARRKLLPQVKGQQSLTKFFRA